MAETKMISIAIVNYTNTLPFKWALKQSKIASRIILHEDIPSICAEKLKLHQVDLALVPVAVLAEMDTYFLETNFCLGTNGKVDSVKLYSDVPLNEIKTVTLDYQSKSSNMLAKVLIKFFWQLKVIYFDAKPGFESEIQTSNAAVVIGDRTFILNGKYKYEYDLAEEWKNFTKLPFVFAAWISTEKLPQEFIEEFNLVLEYGTKNIPAAVESDYNASRLTKAETTYYLTNRMDYNLNEDKLNALNLFLKYIKML